MFFRRLLFGERDQFRDPQFAEVHHVLFEINPTPQTTHLLMEIEEALSLLCAQSTILSLYADYISGMSITELAAESSRSEDWIRERIEAARLCLSRQVRIDLGQGSLEPASA